MSRVARILLAVVLVLAVVVLLFTVVFPWVDRTFMNDPVIGAGLAEGLRSGSMR